MFDKEKSEKVYAIVKAVAWASKEDCIEVSADEMNFIYDALIEFHDEIRRSVSLLERADMSDEAYHIYRDMKKAILG